MPAVVSAVEGGGDGIKKIVQGGKPPGAGYGETL